MPVPTSIASLSQTEGSNSPAGSESPTTADNYVRNVYSYIAMLRDGVGFSDPVQLASAATTSIGGQNSLCVEITGTTTITSFGTAYEGPRFLRFTGALTLTHDATALNLPGAANIATVAGDTAIAVPNQAGNGWNVVQYQRAAGTPLALTDASVTAAKLSGAQTGSAPVYGARAWCLFNGSTIAFAAQGNCSSITDNGVGDYTVNFTTAMPDANYAWALSCDEAGAGASAITINQRNATAPTSSALRIVTVSFQNATRTAIDLERISVIIYR